MDFFIIYIVLFTSIFIHELGHYLASKMFKVPVYQFSIGVGPKIFSFLRYGTEFEVRLLPLGGYIYNDELKYESLELLKIYVICLSGVFLNFLIFVLSLLTSLDFNFKLLESNLINIYGIIAQSLRCISLKNIYILQNNLANLFISMKGTTLWFLLIIVNLTLGLTNLIPLSSLDGNKIWAATISRLIKKSKINVINSKLIIMVVNILIVSILLFLIF